MFQKLFRLKKRISVFMEYTPWLMPGSYVCDKKHQCYWMDCSSNEAYCKSHLRREKCSQKYMKLLSRFRVKNDGRQSVGSILLFSNTRIKNDTPASVKVFNIERDEVVTFYRDTLKMKYDLSGIKYFDQYMNNSSVLLEINEEKHFVREKLIHSLSEQKWSDFDEHFVFEALLKSYADYYIAVKKSKKINVGTLIAQATDMKIGDGLMNLLSDMLIQNADTLELHEVYQHGDLSATNVLYQKDNSSIYIIDYEHFGEYYFLYDLFWFMTNEAIYRNRWQLFDSYMVGTYDDQFLKLFEGMGATFDKQLRLPYYAVFVLQMYIKRCSALSEAHREYTIQYLKKMLLHGLERDSKWKE